jgi:hypothetical protein
MQTFEQVLAENATLQSVGLYRLECPNCGRFRALLNGVLLERCPRCGQPTKLSRIRLRCATSKPVPMVQRWRSDNYADKRIGSRREADVETV